VLIALRANSGSLRIPVDVSTNLLVTYLCSIETLSRQVTLNLGWSGSFRAIMLSAEGLDSMASQRNHIHDSVASETETRVRSLERALAKRDITVPMGQPRRLAIS
jgi:hypothetical protein